MATRLLLSSVIRRAQQVSATAPAHLQSLIAAQLSEHRHLTSTSQATSQPTAATASPTHSHAATSAQHSQTHSSQLDFTDYKAAYHGQPTSALLRAWLVFRLCGVPPFVNHAEQLLALSRKVLGETITNRLVKATFYGHFCAGETPEEVKHTIRRLEARGIGSILDYAAEDDGSNSSSGKDTSSQGKDAASQGRGTSSSSQGKETNSSSSAANPCESISTSTASPAPSSGQPQPSASLQPDTFAPQLMGAAIPVARQYSYSTEQQCDAHVDTFLRSIDTAAASERCQGFAAIKLTALGNPALLERISTAIREVHGLFATFDKDGSGVVDEEEFRSAYTRVLPDADPEEVRTVWSRMDSQHKGGVDYVGWCQRLSLTAMPSYAERIHRLSQQKEPPPGGHKPRDREQVVALADAALTEEEVSLVQAMRGRLARLAEAAAEKGVKLMVDAEHTFFQPAIDHLALELMRQYNTDPERGAVILSTYQAYLADSGTRLRNDLERARREGYILGVKLVRGAYMELERARAAKLGHPSPIWPTIEETHTNYDSLAELLLREAGRNRAEVLLGTHNQASIEKAVRHMSELGLDPHTTNVYFAQLLGMSDHLSSQLGAAGYKVFKYVPYGAVPLVLPYLLRRAAENSSILKGTKQDLVLVQKELLRRASGLSWGLSG